MCAYASVTVAQGGALVQPHLPDVSSATLAIWAEALARNKWGAGADNSSHHFLCLSFTAVNINIHYKLFNIDPNPTLSHITEGGGLNQCPFL